MKRILILMILATLRLDGALLPARAISVNTNTFSFPSGQLKEVLDDLGQRAYSWENPTNGITQAAGDLRWNPLVVKPSVSTNLAWTTNGAEIIVGNANQHMLQGTIVIPSHINYLPVTQIRVDGFRNCTNMTELIMPNTITNIGSNAMCNCSSLSNVVVSTGLDKMSYGFFKSCTNLASFNFPPHLKIIQPYMLTSNKKITSIEIPYGVIDVGGYLCYSGVVQSIVFPETVVRVSMLIGNTNTTSIIFKGNKPAIFDNHTFVGCNENLVVYRNASATGWDSTILGVPVRVLPSAATYLMDTNGVPQDNGHSFTSSGYQKFPTGFMIQWGNYSKSTTNQTHTIDFSYAFSNTVLNVQTKVLNTNAAFIANPDETTYSSTNFNILCGTNIFDIGWFAIGY